MTRGSAPARKCKAGAQHEVQSRSAGVISRFPATSAARAVIYYARTHTVKTIKGTVTSTECTKWHCLQAEGPS